MIVSDYHNKHSDFSASDFCRPLYQLWVSKHFDKNYDDKQNFKAWTGQLIHKASKDFDEVDVVKEFSFILNYDFNTIGGSVDRCVFENGEWYIEDLKTMGNFPAQKAFAEPKKEWIIQLSIYRIGMISRGFKVSKKGIIHQYVMGYQKKKGSDMKEYNRIQIDLLDIDEVYEILNTGINVAQNKEAPVCDCKKYLCSDYCSYNASCPEYNK